MNSATTLVLPATISIRVAAIESPPDLASQQGRHNRTIQAIAYQRGCRKFDEQHQQRIQQSNDKAVSVSIPVMGETKDWRRLTHLPLTLTEPAPGSCSIYSPALPNFSFGLPFAIFPRHCLDMKPPSSLAVKVSQ